MNNNSAAAKVKENKAKGIGTKTEYMYMGKAYDSPEAVKAAAKKYQEEKAKGSGNPADRREKLAKLQIKGLEANKEYISKDRKSKIISNARKGQKYGL